MLDKLNVLDAKVSGISDMSQWKIGDLFVRPAFEKNAVFLLVDIRPARRKGDLTYYRLWSLLEHKWIGNFVTLRSFTILKSPE